jgi:hypothetical protein
MKLLRIAVLMAAALLMSPLEAQGPRKHWGGGISWLVYIPEVQKELRVSDSQQSSLLQLFREMGQKAEALRTQDLPREERGKRFAEFRAEYDRNIAGILDRKQFARLKELDVQRDGTRALLREDVQEDLRLTADQRGRIDQVFENLGIAFRAAYQGFENGATMSDSQREEARRKFEEVKATTDARLMGVLTDSQKRQFQSLQGAPFKFPPPPRGFGGRGRRGGSK